MPTVYNDSENGVQFVDRVVEYRLEMKSRMSMFRVLVDPNADTGIICVLLAV